VIPGIPKIILVAPDSFKGTLGAAEVAEAIARGLESCGHPTDRCPIGDGGEGTLEPLTQALDGELRSAVVADPLGRPIEARFAFADEGRIAVVETAAASGLGLVAASERDAIAASTLGTGELILAAIAAGAQVVYVGVGGSATTDGGAGAIRAIREGGGLRGARLVVLSDVRTPFEDAARVFGPQKGADQREVRRLSQRLNALARRLERDPRGIPMTGAAGGLSGGLWAEFGAELVSGSEFVLDAVDFDRRSLAGKAVSEVATRARQSGVPCHAIVGQRELDSFGARVLDLQAVLEASTLEEIENAGRELSRVL
jgi:glycerate 2-kinase